MNTFGKVEKTIIHNRVLTLAGKMRAAKRIYTIGLVKSGDTKQKIYFCPDCRNAIFQYQGELVSEFPGGRPTNVPITMQCKNTNCGRKIRIEYIATQIDVIE